jgi:hypothetical protein
MEVDKYNAWVRQNFGEDPNLMMQKMGGRATQANPVWINQSTGKLIHAIDASFQNPNTYPQPYANGLIHRWLDDAFQFPSVTVPADDNIDTKDYGVPVPV